LFGDGYAKNIYTKKWFNFLKLLRLIGKEHLFLSSFMFVLEKSQGSTRKSSYVERLLADAQETSFNEGDVLMKVRSSNPEVLAVRAFRKGSAAPYGTYHIPRNGVVNAGQITFRSTESDR
jgi:hypothetical protein